jgi:hypothetical protein
MNNPRYKITIDYETRSKCDISTHGGWLYSKDPSTEVLCLAYVIDDNLERKASKHMWVPPKHVLIYQFNLAATLKGLRGHFNPIKGSVKKLPKAAREKIAERDIAQPVKFPREWVGCVFLRKAVRRGYAWKGFLYNPVWGRKLLVESKPTKLLTCIASNDYEIEAHNVFFEKSIWWNICEPKYDFPKIKDNAWSCSAALAASYGLPRALDKAGEALNLNVVKDGEGKLVMLRVAKPNQSGILTYDVQDFTTLLDYCVSDVLAERAISNALAPLSEDERSVWLLDQKINAHGLPVDMPTIKSAINIIQEYTLELEKRMTEITNGQLNNIRQTQQLKLWIESKGILTDSVDKNAVEKILARKNLNPEVKEVLEIRQKLGQTSTAKYYKMFDMADTDAYIRDQFLYHGANTGRFCIAEGQLVLTKTIHNAIKEKPIEKVLRSDLVWDGDSWVEHEGVVFSGEKEVISYQGLVATPEHIVYTSDKDKYPLQYVLDRSLDLWEGN